MSRRLPILLIALAGVAVLAIALLVRGGIRGPALNQREVVSAIHAAVRQEADTAFVVTGYLEVVATVRSEDTQVVLPNLLNLRLGTSRSTVRVPGRVSYGFDASGFTEDMIRLRGDTIELHLPRVAIFSTEPDLERLEVETTTGWARSPVSAQQAERRAVQLLNQALQRQGEAHLSDNIQPQVNTARAMRRIVEPVVRRFGMEDPYFRVHLGEGVLIEP